MNITPVNRTQNTTFKGKKVPIDMATVFIENSNRYTFDTVVNKALSLKDDPNYEISMRERIYNFFEKALTTGLTTIMDQTDIARFEKEKKISLKQGLAVLEEIDADAKTPTPEQCSQMYKNILPEITEIYDQKNIITKKMITFLSSN